MSILIAKEYYITTFSSTHRALAAEKVLETNGIDFLLIPLPIGISASCGLGVKYFENDYMVIQELFSKEELVFQGNYYCKKEDGKLHISLNKEA